jgi:hypothetical protein
VHRISLNLFTAVANNAHDKPKLCLPAVHLLHKMTCQK